jgi:hypothetical protein
MRNVMTWTWVLAIGVALVAADTASAQQRRGQGRGGFGGGRGGATLAMLLGNEGVQKELKVTDDQKTKIDEFSRAQREKMQELFQGGQPDREKVQEAQKSSNEAAEKLVKDALKPEQQKRLKQIQYQVGGIQSLASNEEVQKALKLSDEQKEKLKTLAADQQKDLTELMQAARGGGGNRQELAQKRTALQKDYMTKAVAVLTADQKKEWKELTGEPFDYQPTFGRGRRGGGGQ